MWLNITSEIDPAYTGDSGHNIYFEQLGYNSRYILRNCTEILLLLSLLHVFCIVLYATQYLRNRVKDKK